MPCPHSRLKRKKKKNNPKKHRKHTPIVSKIQQTAMNIARAVKEGKLPKSALKGASLEIYKGMTKKELISHSEEAKGKKLPKRARLKRKKR